ncbi:hypothetical protein GUJ93_ZPchr0002g26183 [Zizania palustris]|uniref:Uncharacterized protein n=1 Tax=Zizania palustris TaxID=103762 RepID=A0A8J5S408_ZIZPA|nr:hypothetical protein GUJ93_ZPchr0002g26183 [Zizania palustris]
MEAGKTARESRPIDRGLEGPGCEARPTGPDGSHRSIHPCSSGRPSRLALPSARRGHRTGRPAACRGWNELLSSYAPSEQDATCNDDVPLAFSATDCFRRDLVHLDRCRTLCFNLSSSSDLQEQMTTLPSLLIFLINKVLQVRTDK